MNDSLSICVLTYFLEKAEDPEIRPVVEFALELAHAHVKKLKLNINSEKIPIQ